jgi:hypothetical protein
MRKMLCTIVLVLACAEALGSGTGFAQPVEATCAVCVTQAGAMNGAGAMNEAGAQAAAVAALREAALARMEALRSRLPG